MSDKEKELIKRALARKSPCKICNKNSYCGVSHECRAWKIYREGKRKECI